MSHVILAFSSKHSSLVSWLIRRVQRWRHSHVVMLNPAGTHYVESTGDEWIDDEGALRDGVRIRPIAQLYERDDIEFRVIDHPAPYLAWVYAMSYQDRRYDHRYLWAAFVGGDEHDENKLSCPELIRQACKDAGLDPLPESIVIPTVRDFYAISKEMQT